MNSQRRALALGDGVDDLGAAVGAIAADEVARVAGLHRLRVRANARALNLEIANLPEECVVRLLPCRLDDRVALDAELAPRHRLGGAAAARVGLAEPHLDALDGLDVL